MNCNNAIKVFFFSDKISSAFLTGMSQIKSHLYSSLVYKINLEKNIKLITKSSIF